LISYLDGLLEWDQPYFHELMSVFTEQNRESVVPSHRKLRAKESKGQKYQEKVLDYLAIMYKKGPAALDGISVL
jgi:hypothetical protein